LGVKSGKKAGDAGPADAGAGRPCPKKEQRPSLGRRRRASAQAIGWLLGRIRGHGDHAPQDRATHDSDDVRKGAEMPIPITTKVDFVNRVKTAAIDQLLIIHGDSSSRSSINRYNVIALAAAGDANKALQVCTVNIDALPLDPADAATYQLGPHVICCTTITEGIVMERVINPFEPTLRQMVLNILG
jgi:hypothetical protein